MDSRPVAASPPVRYQASGLVARITLNRPETGNAIDDDLAAALWQACQTATEDDTVTVVTLEAEGRIFCSGAAPLPAKDPAAAILRRRVAGAMAAIPKPVIAAIQGDAIGQGLEIALAADLRLAAETAGFAMDQVRHGLIPWDGGTQRLPRAVSKGVALEMLLTGRAMPAREAFENGLVSQCLPADQLAPKAAELAARLASMAPIAAAYAKEALHKGMDMPLDQALRFEADLAVLLQSTSDRAEGIRSFLEKRKPRFTGH